MCCCLVSSESEDMSSEVEYGRECSLLRVFSLPLKILVQNLGSLFPTCSKTDIPPSNSTSF